MVFLENYLAKSRRCISWRSVSFALISLNIRHMRIFICCRVSKNRHIYGKNFYVKNYRDYHKFTGKYYKTESKYISSSRIFQRHNKVQKRFDKGFQNTKENKTLFYNRNNTRVYSTSKIKLGIIRNFLFNCMQILK